MDGITSASPIALFGSLLAHAAFGAAVIGFGPSLPRTEAVQTTVELVAFETVEPVLSPEPEPVIEEPPVIRRAARAPSPAPAPVTPQPEPAPAAAAPEPTAAVAPEPVIAAPMAGLAADTTAGVEAKGFTVGSTAIGAKTGNAQTSPAVGAVSVLGVVGGTGDHSRAAGLADGRRWDCPFPREAEDEGIEGARVTLEVRIGAGNAVESATVVSDPGFGFGHEARRCALRRRWLSQLDRNGVAVAGRATVVVNFVR